MENILEISKLAEELGKKPVKRTLPNGKEVEQIVWTGEDLPKISQILHNRKVGDDLHVKINGASPAWLVASIAHELHPNSVSLNSPDGYIPIGMKKPNGMGGGENLTWSVLQNQDWHIVHMEQKDPSIPLNPNDLDNSYPPELPMGAKVILSGRMPNWLATSVTMAYHGTTKAVALYQPNSGATVAMTHSQSVKLGEVIPEEIVKEAKLVEKMEKTMKKIIDEYLAKKQVDMLVGCIVEIVVGFGTRKNNRIAKLYLSDQGFKWNVYVEQTGIDKQIYDKIENEAKKELEEIKENFMLLTKANRGLLHDVTYYMNKDIIKKIYEHKEYDYLRGHSEEYPAYSKIIGNVIDRNLLRKRIKEFYGQDITDINDTKMFADLESQHFSDHGLILGKDVFKIDEFKRLINNYGQYRPNLTFVVDSFKDYSWESSPTIEKQINMTLNGSGIYVIHGKYYISKKGTKMFYVQKDGPEMLIEISWGGAFDKTRGLGIGPEDALYYRRASSNGGGLGSDYLILPRNYKKEIKLEED